MSHTFAVITRLGAAAVFGLLGLGACTAEPPAPEPPKFTDTDPCTLLRPAEIVDDPREGSDTGTADGSCRWNYGGTTVVVKLLAKPFSEESERLTADGGYGAVVGDRPMTRKCADAAGTVTCEAVVEVRDSQLLWLTVARKHTDPNAIGQLTQGLALKALERLPK